MHGIGARFLDRLKDVGDVEVAVPGRGGSDQNGLVGHFHVQGARVGFGIDGNRLDP